MLIRNYPEDATLRRHVDAAAAIRLEALLAQGPSDSTLRRHYEQMQAADKPVVEHRAKSAQAPTEHRPEPAAPRAAKGGFFGWLSRLFGS